MLRDESVKFRVIKDSSFTFEVKWSRRDMKEMNKTEVKYLMTCAQWLSVWAVTRHWLMESTVSTVTELSFQQRLSLSGWQSWFNEGASLNRMPSLWAVGDESIITHLRLNLPWGQNQCSSAQKTHSCSSPSGQQTALKWTVSLFFLSHVFERQSNLIFETTVPTMHWRISGSESSLTHLTVLNKSSKWT